MADPLGYSVPFLTSQSRAAHPFFLGPQAQGKPSSNVWVDEQLRIRRRPGLIDIGDIHLATSVDSMFEYSYRSRASAETRHLVGASNSSATAIAGVDIMTDRVGGDSIAGAATADQSRARMHTVSAVNGTEFEHREQVLLYEMPADTLRSAAEIIVDNVDHVAADGDVVIAMPGADSLLGTSAAWRLEGQTSGADVTFDDFTLQTAARRIWTTKAASSSSGVSASNQQWQPGAITTFAQFGNLLLMTDDSYLFPIRLWTGGHAEAQFLRQAPRGKYLTTHQGRAWIAGLERNGSEVIGSGILAPYSWEATGRADSPVRFFVEQDDRDTITAINQSFRGDLYIWKNRSMHRITGLISINAPPQFSTITRNIGCCSHRTVQHTGNDMVWMSEKGVHSLATTDKFGDVEQGYLSFPIADVFEELNVGALEKSQAVYLSRLGLYILAVPMRNSDVPNLLLVFSTVSKRWMTWDIGKINSIAVGPGTTGESDTVYVNRIGDVTTNGAVTEDVQGVMSVLDFRLEEDQHHNYTRSPAGTAIPVVIAPGTLFIEDELRYRSKQAQRLQIYHSSPGEFTSNVVFSWDGGVEITRQLGLNPQGDKCLGFGFKLGADELGNGLRSKDDTTVSSVPLVGRGHTMQFRVEDSNYGRLPYLHSDIEYQIGQRDYTSTPRGSQ